MTQKILCVDDDSNVLAAYARSLRHRYDLDIALGPETGLARLTGQGPYAVVVSDMNMPGMNGVRFLARTREIAPETVRIMLTGNADQKTAIDALHEGYVFRFLHKPTPPEALALALDASLEQYRLITAERDLLEKTFSGSLRVLVEILSVLDPHGFERSQRLRQNMRMMAEALGEGDVWQLELTGLLSQIGMVTVPPSVVCKAHQGVTLTEAEQAILGRIPKVGHDLLVHIPRLEQIALAIGYSECDFGGDYAGSVCGMDLPLGARLLRVLSDLADYEAGGLSQPDAFSTMQRQSARYDPRILAAAYICFVRPKAGDPCLERRLSDPFPLSDLRVGQTLAGNVETADGILLIGHGHRLTGALLERLKNFSEIGNLKEPVMIERAVRAYKAAGKPHQRDEDAAHYTLIASARP